MEFVADKLLETIKKKLRVTWNEQDDSIKETILEGMAFLQSRAGELPFLDKESNPLIYMLSIKLLKEYCRYDWNGSIAYFENDYLSDIINLQISAARGRVSNENQSR